ncbi:CGNR zinc finger domain-containing protein [Cryptosporangium sp. NPDC051539]|uniref:CGNR zinc finger domain-containing protein n=1 Tax=Cryptosporangium sp. NPDC051539 TaxID=3363962 RepID=UPI0037BD76C4
MPIDVNARHGLDDAPSGLVIVQELLNTTAPKPWEDTVDLLGRAEDAAEWLGREVSEAELAELREFRDSLRQLLHGDAHPPLRGSVRITVDEAGQASASALSGAGPAEELRGRVLNQILVAQARGDWTRLKLCAFEACDLAFFDLSRNRSGRWCSARCANRINLPKSRERRRVTGVVSGPEAC